MIDRNSHRQNGWAPRFRQWLPLALLLLACGRDPGTGETWRVLSLDLDVPAQATSTAGSNAILHAAASINSTSPDIVLLHGAPNWSGCESLARRLEPASYRVIVCSAFPKRDTQTTPVRQAAILAKTSAYFAWAESWQHGSGGYAFAAFRVGAARVGFFALTLDGAGNPLEFESEWEDAVAGFRGWETNRLDAAVVCAAYGPAVPGKPNQFSSALMAPFPTPRHTNVPAQLTMSVNLPSRSERLPAFLTTAPTANFLLQADAPEFALKLEPPDKEKLAIVERERINGRVNPTVRSDQDATLSPNLLRTQLGVGLGAAAALAIGFILLRRRQALGHPPAEFIPVVDAHPVSSARKPELGPMDIPTKRALETLAADRTILMENQQASTETLRVADDLLARVEARMQQQAAEQQTRIENLNRQLAAADDENQLLLQARIQEIRDQMDLPPLPPSS